MRGPVRADAALLKLMGLSGAPEEASVWRMLEPLGSDLGPRLEGLQRQWTKRVLASASRRDILVELF